VTEQGTRSERFASKTWTPNHRRSQREVRGHAFAKRRETSRVDRSPARGSPLFQLTDHLADELCAAEDALVELPALPTSPQLGYLVPPTSAAAQSSTFQILFLRPSQSLPDERPIRAARRTHAFSELE